MKRFHVRGIHLGLGLLLLAGSVGLPLAQTQPTQASTSQSSAQSCVDIHIKVSGQDEVHTYECLTTTGHTCVVTATPWGVVQTCMTNTATASSSSR